MMVCNSEVVEMVKKSQGNSPKYQFLFQSSPLHPYFQWRVAQLRMAAEGHVHPQLQLRPPRPPPPLGPLPAVATESKSQDGAIEPLDNLNSKPSSSHRYFELPTGLMVDAITEEHAPYSSLSTKKLEDPEFLESVVPGLSTYTDNMPVPELTDKLEQALADFDKGVRYIYKQDEFEYRNDPTAVTGADSSVVETMRIDRDGWTPGVLEKIMWDRRKGSEQRQQWKRKQERVKRRLEGQEVSDSTASYSRSSSESDSSSSDSTGDSSSSSGSSQNKVRPTHVNRAIGSDNVGFQLLSKLGWQQGQGLGAASDGIVEPIRLQTRFSTVNNRRSRGRGRGRGMGRGRGGRVERASIGTGKRQDPVQQGLSDSSTGGGDEQFELFRKQMSNVYKRQHDSPEQ
ncbi:hypothetical protein H4S02_002134 [Coemansia sp. RSA 2611]|nr:hypothetical protein H4S02_002134 [Coemansia sp. RSA 2611]